MGNVKGRVRCNERVATHLPTYMYVQLYKRHNPHNFAHVDRPGSTVVNGRANLDGAFVIKAGGRLEKALPAWSVSTTQPP